MRESFDEYKKTIENNLVNFSYLYDGDILSSTNESYSETLSHKNTSPSVIINCIIDIYNLSISNMINKSIDHVINDDLKSLKSNAINHGSILHHLDDFQKKLKFDPAYIFTSTNGRSMFLPIKSLPSNKPFPDYFYELQKYNRGKLRRYDLYLCPLIEDSEDGAHVYVMDKSIQSLVYSIQNMEYSVEENSYGMYKHTINFKFYDCDFKCYKLIINDLRKIREDKINQILDDN